MVWVPLFTFYNDTDMYKDLGLSFALLFLVLAGLLAAATGVAREVEDRTAGTILAKSVGRWQFVLGKYLGAMGAVLVAARPSWRSSSRPRRTTAWRWTRACWSGA